MSMKELRLDFDLILHIFFFFKVCFIMPHDGLFWNFLGNQYLNKSSYEINSKENNIVTEPLIYDLIDLMILRKE